MDVHSSDFNDFDFTYVNDFPFAFLLLLKKLGVTGQLVDQQLLASMASMSSNFFAGSSRKVLGCFVE